MRARPPGLAKPVKKDLGLTIQRLTRHFGLPITSPRQHRCQLAHPLASSGSSPQPRLSILVRLGLSHGRVERRFLNLRAVVHAVDSLLLAPPCVF